MEKEIIIFAVCFSLALLVFAVALLFKFISYQNEQKRDAENRIIADAILNSYTDEILDNLLSDDPALSASHPKHWGSFAHSSN